MFSELWGDGYFVVLEENLKEERLCELKMFGDAWFGEQR